MSDPQTAEVKMEILLDDETAQGVYANLTVINHSDSEFVLDFIFVQPQAPKAKVRSRVILAPKHLKRLIAAIQENLLRYERLHGAVTTGAGGKTEDDHYH